MRFKSVKSLQKKKQCRILRNAMLLEGEPARWERGILSIRLKEYKSQPRRRTSVGVRVSLVSTTVTFLVSPEFSCISYLVCDKLLAKQLHSINCNKFQLSSISTKKSNFRDTTRRTYVKFKTIHVSSCALQYVRIWLPLKLFKLVNTRSPLTQKECYF
jgi:hypothetical protein